MLTRGTDADSLARACQLQTGIDRLLYWLIPLYLLFDMLNGALLQRVGHSFAIAVLYKGSLLLLMAAGLLLVKPRFAVGFALVAVAMLIGPTLVATQLGFKFWLSDVQLVIKLLAPLLAFSYLYQWRQRNALITVTLLHRTFLISYGVIIINLLLGLAGFGYQAYQPLDNVAQSFLGIKGYFYSTNELSALLLLLNSYVLWHVWQKSRALYLLISALSLFAAVLLLTKTGLFGTALLVSSTPLLFMQRSQDHKARGRKLMIGGITAVVLIVFALYFYAEPLLRWLGVYDKLQFVYQQRGITGILLSSRDFYAERIWQLTHENFDALQRLLGVGQGGIAYFFKKYFAELDLFDVIIFFGIAGGGVYIATFCCFLYTGWCHRQYSLGRVLVLVNSLLFFVSLLAGHVMTSGMLWLPWALLNVAMLSYNAAYAPANLHNTAEDEQ